MKYSFQNKLNIKVSVNEDVFYDEDTNTIYIPLKKKDVLLELIENYRYANLIIKSSCLIDKDVLFAIRNNQNLFSITLGCSEDVYVLTRNDFLLLNESESLFNINTEAVEGKYSFSEMEYLTYFRKNVVGFYKIADFYTSSIFHFHTSLSDEEMYVDGYSFLGWISSSEVEKDSDVWNYIYDDGDFIVFMNMETYDQISLDKAKLEWELKFLRPNEVVEIISYEGEFLGINLPAKVVLKVVKTEPGVKGDTATRALKDATLETGLVIRVPLFVDQDEEVYVRTDTGEYDSRA